MSGNYEALTESYFYILLCLHSQQMHGYGIMQETERLSGGRVKIGSGTMYGAINNMMKKGWIEEVASNESVFERKRMYRLTEDGELALSDEIDRLRELVASADEFYNKK